MIDAADDRIAIVDGAGSHSYAELDAAADRVAAGLLAAIEPPGPSDLGGTRVAIHVPPGFGYVATLLGTWRAGGIAVPLCLSHPDPELAYVLDDTRAGLVVAGGGDAAGRLAPLAAERDAALLGAEDLLSFSDRTHVHTEGTAAMSAAGAAREGATERPALILYTSGTTGRPKGVVLSHGNLKATVDALVEAWGWTGDDRIVHVLPLHHTHGIVNALLCALRVGATVDMLPAFDAATVWERLTDERTSLFMAVPTVYVRLIRAWEAAEPDDRARLSDGARRLRLMVSGSAALPVPVFERWREITGHTLLERYGMTEIGMALSNPLHGERRPGHVGRPLPGVEIRLLDEDGAEVDPGLSGEIHVRGPAVFREYWERPAETASAFRDGWFRTGDVAIVEDGAFRILGRRSVDIIKTGGYKVSALEIENVLGGHPSIDECAVVGVADPDWGEAVCAALVARRDLDRDEVRDWARERLAPYKLPTRVLRVGELPKNAMGKVTKPAVRALFEAAPAATDALDERTANPHQEKP
ncbi:MAG: acyl-CoA synthetase [Gemmatimonadales bacterium]|jgi:malonyl-CoA/methylmalonyl-CoA synthetase